MIAVTRDDHVTTIELRRPERRNALNSELADGLRTAVEQAVADDIRAILDRARVIAAETMKATKDIVGFVRKR